MKTISTEFQNELIEHFEKLQQGSPFELEVRPAYYLEQLRPKRVRKKEGIHIDVV